MFATAQTSSARRQIIPGRTSRSEPSSEDSRTKGLVVDGNFLGIAHGKGAAVLKFRHAIATSFRVTIV